LNSWKGIATCFGRGLRTIQCRENALGLPVYRIDSLGGEIVYALRPELDIWLVSTDLEELPAVFEQPDASGNVRGECWGNGVPLAFLLFPRLDVAVADDDSSDVVNIFVDALRQIMVDVGDRASDRVAPELRRASMSTA
jgi:hypothetical protein